MTGAGIDRQILSVRMDILGYGSPEQAFRGTP
jgi:hypothetical protein